MSETGSKPPLERAVELMVYAPIGLLQFARDVGPTLLDQFVTRGRDQVAELQKRVENQVGQLRILGQFAVAQGRQQFDQGRQQIEEELGNRLGEVRRRGERVARMVVRPADDGETASLSVRPAASPNGTRGDAPRPNGAGAREFSLPIPDYDELSASQVVDRLAGLADEELTAIRDYELSQRQRRTILTRIEQLGS